MRPREIVLFCDYEADPVWHARKPRAMIALDSLPLSDPTKAALRAWAASYERLEEHGYEWPEPAGEADHDAEGERLRRIVQEELGPDWKVGLLPESGGRIRW